ncbi:hypothetical protein RJ639_035509 [Escallonia herrerae]|uniref:CCHC-type domain-containing protein n=1 Tax=Escallonia herrerae TaxID=1293975 RepID=A0AA88WRQ7_9ASTE|nr:hypothetical protein RJ639_035509 [Escallonia herrerae]
MAPGRSTDHVGSKNKERLRSQSNARNLKCYKCYKEGHYRKECPERKGKKKDNSKMADDGVVKDNFDGADVLSARSELKNLISLDTLDSNGCSYRAISRVMRIMKGALVVMTRSLSTAIDCKTPEDVWSGKHANYGNLRIFGCPTYAHVNDGKLKPRANKCIFLGYASGVKGYRLWCFDSRSSRFLISKDESSMLSKKKELIDARKDHGVKEKVELEKIVSGKWVYNKKEGIPRIENARYKARLVANGFTQREGIDYNEIFSPVVKRTSIRVLLTMVALYDLELEQLDVKTAFIQGELEEQIFMRQPEGFVIQDKEAHVYLLKKS